MHQLKIHCPYALCHTYIILPQVAVSTDVGKGLRPGEQDMCHFLRHLEEKTNHNPTLTVALSPNDLATSNF